MKDPELYGTRSSLPPSCATLEKVTIMHTFRVREISPLDQYESSFVVTLLILKPKYEPPRYSVTYYYCILLPNVLGIHTARAGSSVRELPEFPTRYADYHVQYIFFQTVRNYSMSTNANYRCTHLNECTNYRSTSFAYRLL
ncbi:PREDICTED: uncharacterized protein LOC108693781 [Atta colombica]|uniref:uncharacterized protein LOC108693781 n=1 Tax=Atta colombica TaxID=520822 RepID=UPI00084CA4C7|nr:PREDICTED: uncharacterized protein LOC108693781 [Atta colombica]